MQKIYYSHIDGLRALAVLSVVLYHLGIPFITGGFIGVDIFFVISGYLITNIILKEIQEKDSFDFTHFYFRRAKRIIPALFFTLLISFIFAIWLLTPAKFRLFGGTLAAAAASVSNIFLYRQAGYFDIFSKSNPLLHTWSLGVEEQFYIFWPIFLLIIFKLLKGKYIIPAAIASVGLISLCLNLFAQGSYASAIFYYAPCRAFEFCIGAALVWLPVRIESERAGGRAGGISEILFILGLVLILWPLFFYTEDMIFPSYNALAPTLGSALLIYAGSAKFCGKLLRNRMSVFFGIISYSLYLVHWPIIVFTKTYNELMGHGYNLLDKEKIVVFAASIFIAFLMYKFIEKPIRKINFSKKAQEIKFLAKQGIAILFIVSLGAWILYGSGWLWRTNVPESSDDIAKYHAEYWGGAGFKGGVIHSGKKPEPSIVMMGDSHSGMLDTGIVDQIAKPLDITIFTASGGGAGKYATSLLLPGTTKIDKNQEPFDRSSRNASKEVTEELYKSDGSILMYSANYTKQLRWTGNIDTHLMWQITPESTSDPKDYQKFLDALERMRSLLGGRKFIIIGQVPTAVGYKTSLCIAKLKWFAKTIICQTQDARTNNIAAININKILKGYAQAHDNVYFIDPYDFLCDEIYCANVDEAGAPLYSDDSHFSKKGSIYFFKKAREKIIHIINTQ